MKTNNNVDAKNGQPKWSVMVYLAGGRDVSDEALGSLLRMKYVGSTEHVRVIAQFDSGSEGTFTKRYNLKPLKNALWIESLLIQACLEVPASASINPSDSTIATFYFERLMDALPENQRKDLQSKHQTKEMIELLKYYPYRFKNLIIDCILDADLDIPDGNQGDTNAGDPKVLVEFVKWAKYKYPSDYTMVIIWGHGSGLSVAWDFSALQSRDTGDSLTVIDLSDAFEKIDTSKGPRIDIVGFNSCSLGTIEVYRQLKDLVRFGVASEGFTPKTSWPYEKILEALNKRPEMLPDVFAKKIVDEYIHYYEGSVKAAEQRQNALRKIGIRDMNAGLDWNKEPALAIAKGPNLSIAKGPNLSIAKGPNLSIAKGPNLGPEGEPERRGIDLSACELEKSTEVEIKMHKLVKVLLPKLVPVDSGLFGAILGAHAVSQSYFNKDFTDLHDFCRALKGFCHNQDVKHACEQVMTAITEMCIKKGHVGEDVRNSNGVSIFFPWDDWGEKDVTVKYKGLKFLDNTDWHKFLEKYRALVDDFERGDKAFSAGN